MLSASAEYVGNSGAGTFTQAGGTNSVGSGGLYLGYNSGSGTYTLSGSGVLLAVAEYLGTDGYGNSSGTGTFNQAAGLNAVNYLGIGSQGLYQFSGGTLQVTGGGLADQGVFDATQGRGLLTVTGSAIIDFSQGSLVNTSSMSLAIGPDSLLLLPAGFNVATAFHSYSNLGLTHTVGSTLTIATGQGFAGIGSIADPVTCQGTIAAVGGGAINLNGGVTVSGTGNIDLGSGQFIVNDAVSGMTGGSLLASYGYVGNSGTGTFPQSGTFTQSGGTNSIGTNGELYLGYNAGDSGAYLLGGSGVLSAFDVLVGYWGTGTFTQSGGTHNCIYLDIGINAGSSGVYNLSGSGVLSAATEYVGDTGTGTFTQSGGTNIVGTYGELYVGYSNSSSGAIASAARA